jgi:hypothetical protein
MIQSPCVQPAPAAQQPNYNAVKIDIHNPSVGVNGQSCQQPQVQNMQYTDPVYNYPQAPVYNYPNAGTQPCYYPPVNQAPQQVNVNNAPAQQQAPEATQAPEVPEPVVSEPEAVKSEPVQPEIDLNSFTSRLSSSDIEQQKQAMEEISKVIKEDETNGTSKASALVDSNVFKALNDIVSFDTSKLEGPTKEQAELRQKKMNNQQLTPEEVKLAETITPMEKAELNKSYALFSIAMLDRVYANEVMKLSNKLVPLTELPEAVNVVNQLKDNPNPMVRASAIEALSYIQEQRPEYNKDLTTLFEVAKKDQDPNVVERATEALNKIGANK